MKINLVELKNFLGEICTSAGLSESNAKIVSDIYMRATYRNVGHHDIHDLVPRIKKVISGDTNAEPSLEILSNFGATARFDGDNGLGEIACEYIMEKAIELADVYGIAICTACNTNHFLCSYPYLQKASEKGYVAMLLAKSAVGMTTNSSDKACMSVLPMGIAYPTEQEPVIADFCLAYTSMGELNLRKRNNQEIKEWWGKDKNGNFTTNPAEVLQGGVRMAMGDHKGFALSMLGEVLTGVIAGTTIMDVNSDSQLTNTSHTAIVINPKAFMPIDEFKGKTSVIGDRAKELSNGTVIIPGENSNKKKNKIITDGYIELENSLVDKLNELANELNIKNLGE